MKELELLEELKELHELAYGNEETSWKIDEIRMSSHIKQALIKSQKQEKALEILKRHFNFTFDDKHNMLIIAIQAKEDEDTYDTTACTNIQFLGYNPNVYNENAKEEFNLLKEVLCNEAKED